MSSSSNRVSSNDVSSNDGSIERIGTRHASPRGKLTNMVWLWAAVLVVAPVVVALWLARRVVVHVDDALALRLASELGTSAPTFEASRRAWRVELDGTELWIGPNHVTARRAIERPVGEGFTVLESALVGREQEDYFFSRIVVPDGDGGWCVGGRSDALTEVERRVVEARPTDLPWLRVEPGALSAGTLVDPTADDVRALIAALADVARALS